MNDKFHVSSKAVIVRDNRMLLIQYQDKDNGETGYHYNLPGGKMHANESAVETLRRKVMEEAGAKVDSVSSLLFVYEYIGKNHGYMLGDKHSVSLVFRCTLQAGSEPSIKNCTKPDAIQTDVCWIPLSELTHIILWPNVAEKLLNTLHSLDDVNNPYWGDIV